MFNTEGATFNYLYAVYNTLRKIKAEEFRPENFKIRLGIGLIRELCDENYISICRNESITLFGIIVERDFVFPQNIQIFEDITNKISIPFEEYKRREEESKCQNQ